MKDQLKQNILIVDDEEDILELLEFNLSNEGYIIETTISAETALEKDLSSYNLILLDVMMGGMSGFKMAETLRKNDINTPIIFLTAKETENDMLTGFSVGADDYISKPFSIKEVIARVKAVLKRNKIALQVEDSGGKFEFNGLVIDYSLKELTIMDKKVPLTKTEYEILSLFCQNPNRVFSREIIIDKIWKTPYITERTVDVHITRLRKKLGKFSSIISNRSGFGYHFNKSAL